jgi:hypothetical protein
VALFRKPPQEARRWVPSNPAMRTLCRLGFRSLPFRDSYTTHLTGEQGFCCC